MRWGGALFGAWLLVLALAAVALADGPPPDEGEPSPERREETVAPADPLYALKRLVLPYGVQRNFREGPPSPRLMLVVPATIGFALLVAHSIAALGGRATLLLFGLLGGLSFWKEWHMINRDEYLVDAFPPELAGVPLVIPLGWVYAIYLSFSLARQILATRFPRYRDALFPVLAVFMMIMAAFGLLLEVTGSNVGWWTWAEAIDDPTVSGMPIHMLIAWPTIGLVLLAPVLIFLLPNDLVPRLHPALAVAGWFTCEVVLLLVLTSGNAVLLTPVWPAFWVACFRWLDRWKMTRTPSGLHRSFARSPA